LQQRRIEKEMGGYDSICGGSERELVGGFRGVVGERILVSDLTMESQHRSSLASLCSSTRREL